MTEKQNIQREPLVRLAKRDDLSGGKKWAIRLVAIVLALVVGSLFIAVLGHNPIAVYHDIITGSLGGPSTAKVTVRVAIPLLGAALAIAPAFKMKFWNIGAEGQIMVGGIAATYFALYWYDKLPKPALLIVMAVASILAGGIWGLVPAFCKARWGTNETLFTLMLNYIALYLLQFLGETKAGWNFFLDPDSARPKFAGFPDNADMITFPLGPFNLNLSLIIAIVLCVLLFGYLKYTKHGYEIAVVGDSPNTARYAGMKVGRIVVRTIFLSAALIGLAGAFYVSSAGTLSTSVTNDVGWTGIVVAWLAKLNTVGIVITALLITVLQFGCQAASTTYSSIDANFADLIQGIILFAVLAADFFTRFRLARRAAAPKEVSK